jgi:hypothetical protein
MYNDCNVARRRSRANYLINSERSLMPKECVLCGLSITSENDSKEHLFLIPSAAEKKLQDLSAKIATAIAVRTGTLSWPAN